MKLLRNYALDGVLLASVIEEGTFLLLCLSGLDVTGLGLGNVSPLLLAGNPSASR